MYVFVYRLHISVIGCCRQCNLFVTIDVECVKMIASAKLTAAYNIIADIRLKGVYSNKIIRAEIAVIKIIIVVLKRNDTVSLRFICITDFFGRFYSVRECGVAM